MSVEEAKQNINKYEKDYSSESFLSKMGGAFKKVGLRGVYTALLLFYALDSPNINWVDRGIIIGALGYFISPLDIIPDCIPIIGYTDDVGVLVWAFMRIKNRIDDSVRQNAKNKLRDWFGSIDESEISDL